MTQALLLEGRGLTVRYGRARVLRGVDVAVESGRVLALLGPTGAGKTTLFRVLVGDLAPEEGRVWLAGRDVTGLPIWKRVRCGLGYIPQAPSVLPDLDMGSNLRVFEKLAGRGERGPEYWAGVVGLSHRLSLRAGDLSGGERRLLEMARALIGQPDVLVCDEPFAGIDPAGAMRVAELLRDRAAHGLGILLSDHHAAIALRVCDEAALLVDGAIVVRAPRDRFAAEPMVRDTYLGGSLDGSWESGEGGGEGDLGDAEGGG